MRIQYDGKRFRNTHDGPQAPMAVYRQDGDLLWATFAGGSVRRGGLTGLVAEDGTLRFTYSMTTADGRTIAGQCRSEPELLPDGRIRLREEWERYGEHAASGVSFLEEVR